MGKALCSTDAEKRKSLDAVLQEQLISAASLERALHRKKDASEVNQSLQDNFDELTQVLERKKTENDALTLQKNVAIAEIKDMRHQCEMEKGMLENRIG